MRQLAGSGRQAELGAGAGAGAGLQAEESVAELLQDSHLKTGLWLVGPGSGVTIYFAFTPLNLLLQKQWRCCCWWSWLLLTGG